MKKIMKSVIGVSLSLGLSSLLYATDTTESTDTGTGNNSSNTCYAVSDDIAEIYIIKPDSTNVQEATIISTSSIHGDTKGKYNGEASAFNSQSKKLYLFNNPFLGTTDDDNKFDLYSVDISDVNNPKQQIIKKNFINFEPTGADYYNEKLYIIEEGTTSTLYIYNTKTWEIESQLSISREIAAFAINHKTGDAYVMDDRDTSPIEAAELLKLDLKTGALTSVGVLSNDDFDGESLSFGADGKLYTENERKESKRSIYEISTADASVTLVAYLPGENSNDIESISCSSSDVVLVKPTTDDKVNPKMLNNLGALNILNLSGKDANGDVIEKFTILSLPSSNQGLLYMADGATLIEVDQTLTLEEAKGIKFDPNENFEGDVTFIYVAVDSNGLIGNEATVTIPVISPVKPTTDDKTNSKILNTLDAIDIVELSGTDFEGNIIEKFIIKSLPLSDTGVLYMADGKTPVTLNQELTLEEAKGLKFDPKAGFEGNALFTYQSIDKKGVKGNIASVTLPIFSIIDNIDKEPITDNHLSPKLFNDMSSSDIINLSGTDFEGNAVNQFMITSLPSANQGVLYMADGTTPVTVNQELTLEEANGLKFDPKEGFVGSVTFNYRAIDSTELIGNEATITIPVAEREGGVTAPKTDNKRNDTIFTNVVGAVDIINLSGTDADGNAVKRFIITSLPSEDQGILYMADGTTPVTLNQELTLEEANGLRFDPKEGFVGDVIFNYVGLDTNGVRGNEATVTIPVIKEVSQVLPITDNKVNPKILNSLGAVDITDLSGTDSKGNAVTRFIITALPSEDQGVLYMADGTTPVTLNQELTLEEANGLKFDPNENFEGDALFSYIAIDDQNLQGNVATVTIPVVKDLGEQVIVPVADDKINPAILNSLGAVNITNLSGTDANGTTIERFIITSLPSVDQGILYMADGTTPVTLNQELTLEEANGLRFDPNGSFVGDAVFNYVALDNNGVKGDVATVTIPVISGTTEECVCEDYTEDVPVLNRLGILLTMLFSSLFGLRFIRKEGEI